MSYWVLLGFAQFRMGFTGFYWVLHALRTIDDEERRMDPQWPNIDMHFAL